MHLGQPIAGIKVVQHFEANVVPLRVQVGIGWTLCSCPRARSLPLSLSRPMALLSLRTFCLCVSDDTDTCAGAARLGAILCIRQIQGQIQGLSRPTFSAATALSPPNAPSVTAAGGRQESAQQQQAPAQRRQVKQLQQHKEGNAVIQGRGGFDWRHTQGSPREYLPRPLPHPAAAEASQQGQASWSCWGRQGGRCSTGTASGTAARSRVRGGECDVDGKHGRQHRHRQRVRLAHGGASARATR